MPGWQVSDKSWWEFGIRLETDRKQLERNWKGLENLMGVEGIGGVGSNARKRGKCLAD